MVETLSLESDSAGLFEAVLRTADLAMVITDPRQIDNPIVFANDAFLALTGYGRDEVLGRNCRFLQGAGTDPAAAAQVGEAIARGVPITIDLLNYRKDGTTFFNALHLSPVPGKNGDVRYFFAAQLDVTERHRLAERYEEANRALSAALATSTTLVHEIDHRVKNNLQMVSAMILLQSRDQSDPVLRVRLLETLARVEALTTLHRRLHQSDDVSRFHVAGYVGDLVDDLLGATGRSDIRVDLDLGAVVVPASQSAAIALLFNEIVTNAFKHAFRPGIPGTLRIGIGTDEDGRIVAIVQDDGIGMPAKGGRSGSFGLNLIETLIRQLDARMVVEPALPSGTRIVITLPRTGSASFPVS